MKGNLSEKINKTDNLLAKLIKEKRRKGKNY